MDSTKERINRAEQRLARIVALQETMDALDIELTTYRETLVRKLNLLQKLQPMANPPAPAAAAPRPVPGAQVVPGKPSERRNTPRRKGNPVPVLLTNVSATLDPFQGWVLDRSSGGLRILVDQQVAVGTVLNVRPAKAHDNFPWVQIKVRSCAPERSSYNLGVQFVQKLGWGEMQAFG